MRGDFLALDVMIGSAAGLTPRGRPARPFLLVYIQTFVAGRVFAAKESAGGSRHGRARTDTRTTAGQRRSERHGTRGTGAARCLAQSAGRSSRAAALSQRQAAGTV